MSHQIVEADAENWNKIISDTKKPVMVMFYMESCPHCMKMKPVYEEIATKYGDKVTFVQINAMSYIDITKKYGINAAPAFKFFKNGNLLNEEDKVLNAEQLNQIASDLATGQL